MYPTRDTCATLTEALPATIPPELMIAEAPSEYSPFTHLLVVEGSGTSLSDPVDPLLVAAYIGENAGGVPSLFPQLTTPPAEAYPFSDIDSIYAEENTYEVYPLSGDPVTLVPSPLPRIGITEDRAPRPPAVGVGKPITLRPGVASSRYSLVTAKFKKDDPTPIPTGVDLYGIEKWLSDSRILVRYGEPYMWVRDRHMNVCEHFYGYIKHACSHCALSMGAGNWIPAARMVNDTISSVLSDSAYSAPEPDDEDMSRYAFFRNGMLDIRSLTLMPATEDIFHTNVLDADYDESVEHPLMQQWFDQILPDPEEQRLFFEYAGYTLYHRYNDARAFIVLTGIAKGGKSWAMNAVRSVFGTTDDGSVATMSVKNLGEKFKLWMLRDAQMLIIDEVDMNQSKTGWMGSDDLKNWSAGGNITAEKKNKDSFTFPCRTKFWFASNHSPVFGSDSGVWDRYKVLAFDHAIPKSQGKVMYETIKTDRTARTWIAMRALDAYLDLLERDLRWTEPVRAQATKREIMANGDTFNQWVTALSDDGCFDDFPEETPVSVRIAYYLWDIPCQEAYGQYRDFVRGLYGDKGPAMSPGNFASKLRIEHKMVPVQYRANGKRQRSYRIPEAERPLPPGKVA